MKFYLLRPDNTVSDIAEYPEKPADREDGEWVEGDPDAQALDAEYAKASEQMDVNKQYQIGLKRQELRDVTLIPKSIKTVDQLRAYVPNAFKE